MGQLKLKKGKELAQDPTANKSEGLSCFKPQRFPTNQLLLHSWEYWKSSDCIYL